METERHRSHRSYLREAVRLAVENVRAGRGGPFGALIVRDGEVVGRGTNRVTTDHDPTLHAEVAAIRDAARRLRTFRLDGCDIYASCEPCPMCLGAVYWARLDRVFYAAVQEDAAAAGFDDAFLHEELARPPGERRLPARRMAVEEAGRPFREWERAEDRVEY